MTLAQMSQESFCCEVWCRLFYGRHYNNTDQWPKDKLEWPKKERIKTGKLLGSCSPFIYLTSRTSKFHVMPLWMHLYSCSFYEEKWQVALVKLDPWCELICCHVKKRSASWYYFKCCLVFGDTGPVEGTTCWYLEELGRGWYWLLLGGTGSV